MTSYRSYSHSVQFFRPVKAIVRTDEANSMAFLQMEFLPSNDTLYVATKTSRIPRKAKRFFRWGIFCFEYPRRRSGKGNVYFANYRFSFRKLQIFISQTTDFHFANYRFPFRKLQIFISQTTDFHFANYRFSFRFVPFRFANYSKPVATKTSRIPRKAKRFSRWGIFCFEYPRRHSGKGNVYFANYRFSFRKLQIFISQTTDFRFANYRFPFLKLQILISQTIDFHFANYRFPFRKLQISISFRPISSRKLQ